MHSSPKYMYQFILVIVVLILSSLACNAILSDDDDDDPTPSGVVQGGSPDLVISTGHAGMEVTGGCLDEYGPITSKICVENRGNASAGTFLLGVSDGTNWTVNGLNPGETVCFESELDLSAATVTADANNEVAESNENNNTWTIPVPTPPALCNREVEEPTPAIEPDISFQGVSFSYDDSLATSISPETVPEEAEAGIDSWNTPNHIQFIFNGYPLPDTFHTPRIMVFPVDAYNAINPTAGEIIYQLQQLLQSQPENPEDIPFLPVFNAAQFMQANVNYLRFQNGEGVRFLTQYGQAAWPINNDDMFYTFQGITDDGQFYISAILPISHPSLPDPETVTMDDSFYEDFIGYVAVVEGQLTAEMPNSYTPTLLVLDAMIESLLVTEPN